jgi:hypothetical protein
MVLALLAGCGTASGTESRASATPTPVATTAEPMATATARHHRRPHPQAMVTTAASTPAAALARPAFRWHSGSVSARWLGKSWHRGCPVRPRSLRRLSLTYWGFDRDAHRGTLVVAAANVPAVVAAFRTMYAHRFPVRRMRPVSAYGGSDDRSMAHDNTSAFNCRYAVSNGPKHWSMHAYGGAIDINPRENPYRLNGEVLPPSGAPYMDRSNVRRGMIVDGSVPVRAFAAVGWGWGGRWASTPDYQHFSSTGG